MTPRLVPLHQVDPAAEAVFGGKACGLARLIASGARVPEGFVLEATTILPDAWSEETRGALRREASRLLASGPLAVRSSAVGEDSAARSFAGLFETVLGVALPEAALRAAARCILSGASERVRAYAGAEARLPVGVVIQLQVAARGAGVCFTADPAGKDRAVVIEAVAGAGEALVSGRAQPERWRLYRSGLGGWEARRDPRSAARVLTAEEAIEIASQAARLAESLGHPLDLEWAIDDDGLWWLQARPITVAASPPAYDIERGSEGVDDGPVTVWSNWNVRETVPDPFFPLTWTIWRDVIVPMVVEQTSGVSRSSPLFPHLLGLDLVHGRLYFNMNAMLAWPGGRRLARFLKIIDARAGEVVGRLIDSGVLRARRVPGSRARLLLGVVRAGLMSAVRLAGVLRPRRCLARLEACAADIARRPRVSSLTDAQLLHEMRLIDAPEARRLRDGMQMEMVAMLVYAAARAAFRRHPEAQRLLASGLPRNPTTEISLGIDDLVEAARPLAGFFGEHLTTAALLARIEDEPGGAAWLGHLRAFLARFGQRAPKEFDLGAPRWAEDPTMILDLVRAGLASPSGERTAGRLERLSRERRRAVEAAASASPLWRRGLLRSLARLVELYMPLREAPKHYAMFVFQRMRQAALEMGSRLVAGGLIDGPDEVFFLEWSEVQDLARGEGRGVDYRARVRERRARCERHLRERAPDFLRSDGVPVVDEAEETGAEGVLRGTGISAGRVTGPVRVLREPDPRAMADGDVIVMEFADPGWTPLFPRARAVVMEVGGLMCHAAIVARELGVPAVFGVHGATSLLRDGHMVTVDGEEGTVALG